MLLNVILSPRRLEGRNEEATVRIFSLKLNILKLLTRTELLQGLVLLSRTNGPGFGEEENT